MANYGPPHELITLDSMMWASGSDSTHFVKYSTTTSKNFCYLDTGGNGLKISIFYYAKGHGVHMGVISMDGSYWIFVFLWQASHSMMKTCASYCIMGQ